MTLCLLSEPPHPQTNCSSRSTVVLRASIEAERLQFARKLQFDGVAWWWSLMENKTNFCDCCYLKAGTSAEKATKVNALADGTVI